MSTNLTTTTSITSTLSTTTTSTVQSAPQTPQPVSSSSLLDVLRSIFSRIMDSDTTMSTSNTSMTATNSAVQVVPETSHFSMLPEEKIIQIFGLFDCQTLGRIARVCKYFEQLQKDDALWVVKFGSNLMDQCVLDLRKKTLTIPSPWPNLNHFVPPMNYPAVPKGSFVVFMSGVAPSTVIKGKKGSVESITHIPTGISDRFPVGKQDVVLEFRKSPTQYIRFKIIAPNPKSMKEGFIEAQQLIALAMLELTDVNFNSNLQQWRKS